jgi:DNA repair ATPase RecN
MTPEQIAENIQQIQQKIAVIETTQKNDNARIEENKALIKPLITQLERLATNFEHLIVQVKGSNERMDKIVENTEVRLEDQGERISKLNTITGKLSVITDKLIERMNDVEADVDRLKTKGSKRLDYILDGIIGKVICVVLGAVLMAILYYIGVGRL